MAKQKDLEMRDDEALEETGTDPRVYELGFHLDPELPSEEVKKAYQAIRTMIAEKGEVIAEGEPRMVQLAYTISRQETSGRRDFDSAHFSWIAYETTPAEHAEIVSAAGADKRIIRFIDLVTTKETARHSLEMHELAMKTPERATDPEAAAALELDAALENVAV